MPSPRFDRRLTSTDASFLYLERKAAPMQIGAVAILENDMTYEEFVANIAPRIPKIPRFRQRAVPTPYSLGHPTWEFDPKFDLSKHLFVHELDGPGDDKQLREAVAPIYSRLLSRDKALWELHLIRGLEGGRCAVASSIHHAMVDGVGGNEILGNLYDIQPEHKLPPEQSFTAEPIPNAERRIVDAVWDSTSTTVDAWAKYSQGLLDTAKHFGDREARESRRALQRAMPKLFTPLRRLPFNRACSGKRELAWSEFSFSEFRAIRGKLGVTVNDVVLTVLAGAIGRYAEHHGQRTSGRMMRVMVPVNARQQAQEGELGNQVSVLPTNIPIGITDPIERAEAIAKTTKALKESGIAYELQRMTNLFGGIMPAPYQAILGSFVNPIRPVFNMTCTNVPGPQIPLYFAGRKLERYLPMVPVGHESGLGCPIFTYNQKLVIGMTADVRACPDVERVKEYMDASFEEVRRVAGVDRIEPIEIAPRQRAMKKPQSESVSGSRQSNGVQATTEEPVTIKAPLPVG